MQKYLVLTAHIITPRLVVVNEAFWKGLKPGDQKIIQDAVDAGIIWQNAELVRQEKDLVETFKAADSFPLLAAPLFIRMGNIMNSAGITQRIFRFATVCVGWMRGGLCHANIVASVFFAGTSGSAVADAGGLGTIEIKAMVDEGYSPDIAAAVTASSATIGPIIPPSLPMIIYGVSAEASSGALFLAGVIPGLLMAGALMVMVRAMAIKLDLPRHPFPGFRDLWVAFREAFWALLTPLILFAGLFGGVFTPTEAAAISVAYALVLGLAIYREFDHAVAAADHPAAQAGAGALIFLMALVPQIVLFLPNLLM